MFYYREISMTEFDVFNMLKKRSTDSHKGDFGTLTVIAGSNFYRGAAVLAVLAALRSGTGIVCLASVEKVIESAAAKINECTYFPLTANDAGSISEICTDALIKKVNRSTSCLAGCGMTNCEDTKNIITGLLRSVKCQMVLDADALNSISDDPTLLKEADHPPIITPHMGEMARLTKKNISEIKEKRERTALAFACKNNCIVVLKDYITVVAEPSGKFYMNKTGNPGLSKGGSGDVLAGMIAAFTAQNYSAYNAAVAGVYLHGLAADRCAYRLSQYGMLPSDILTDLCDIFRENDR